MRRAHAGPGRISLHSALLALVVGIAYSNSAAWGADNVPATRPCAALTLDAPRSHKQEPLFTPPYDAVAIVYCDGRAERLPTPSGARPSRAALGLGDSLVAFLSGGRAAGGVPFGSLTVMSVSGEVALEMTNALDFVWGPGDQLAVSRGGFDSEGNAYPESLTIWDARSRASRTYPVSAPGICWGDSTTVLLDDWRTITELTLPGAKRRVSRYHGLQASPDGRYSLSRRPESSDVLWDEVRKRDITAEVVQLIGQPLLTFDTSASAFWIGGTRPGHLLAVPIMGRRGGADDVSSGFEVRVVDVMSLRVVRSLPGRFLAPWPDRSGLIVSVGRGLRSISLRD